MTEQPPNNDPAPNDGIIDQVGRGIGGIFKFIVRLTFTLALAIGVGAAIYYGITIGLPALDQNYLRPVRENASAVAALEAQATQTSELYTAHISDLQTRLIAIEIARDDQSEAVAAIDIQLATLTPLLATQSAHTQEIERLNEAIIAMDDALAAAQADDEEALRDLSNAVTILEEQSDYSAEQIYLELQMVKAMALLTRTQIYVLDANFGLARDDVELAKEILVALSLQEAFSEVNLTPIIARLDLALASFTSAPEQALADLDIAWELLSEGIGLGAAATADETPAPTETPAP